MTIDELRAEMKSEFADVRTEMKNEFADVRTGMKNEFAKIRTEMKAEGETTRRHFDIMVEKITDSVQIVAEVNAHHTSRLDKHEARLKVLEKNRRA